MNNEHIDPERIRVNTVSSGPLPLQSPPKRVTTLWQVILSVAGVALLIGSFFLGQATKPAEIQEVEKEVVKERIVQQIPQVCLDALLAYERYGKNLSDTVTHYEKFVETISGELNGRPSPASEYETLGLTIGITKSLAEDEVERIDKLIPECHATM